MPTKAPSVSAKYKELLKEYVDTESTVSSSDIRDDVSSVASDGIFCTFSLRIIVFIAFIAYIQSLHLRGSALREMRLLHHLMLDLLHYHFLEGDITKITKK